MEPLVTLWVATSAREWFIKVLEKKVSTSITARKIMAAFLTHPLFFTLTSMGFSPRQIEIKLQYRLP